MDDGLLRSAYALQQAGNLSEAVRLYGEIVRATAGLPELVADSPQAYEETALKLACEPSQLAATKAKLDRNRAHPPFDAKHFAPHLEAAYARMRERAERGLRAESFTVEAELSGLRP